MRINTHRDIPAGTQSVALLALTAIHRRVRELAAATTVTRTAALTRTSTLLIRIQSRRYVRARPDIRGQITPHAAIHTCTRAAHAVHTEAAHAVRIPRARCTRILLAITLAGHRIALRTRRAITVHRATATALIAIAHVRETAHRIRIHTRTRAVALTRRLHRTTRARRILTGRTRRPQIARSRAIAQTVRATRALRTLGTLILNIGTQRRIRAAARARTHFARAAIRIRIRTARIKRPATPDPIAANTYAAVDARIRERTRLGTIAGATARPSPRALVGRILTQRYRRAGALATRDITRLAQAAADAIAAHTVDAQIRQAIRILIAART